MTASTDVWVVIPAYNEGAVVGDVVRTVRQRYVNVVVIDDCSGDDTGDSSVAAGATVLRHPINLGQGAALATGIQHALRSGAEYIVTFDADGQHRAEDIDVLVQTQRHTGADVVFGSRFIGRTSGLPPARRLILGLAVLFTRVTTGLQMSDAHNGLRLLTRRAAQAVRLTHNGMAHASELVSQVAQQRLRYAEAPVTILYTEYSLAKGQKLGNAFHILNDLLLARLHK
jgi:glycosyltransferase involved in cell wall biosynthesis